MAKLQTHLKKDTELATIGAKWMVAISAFTIYSSTTPVSVRQHFELAQTIAVLHGNCKDAIALRELA